MIEMPRPGSGPNSTTAAMPTTAATKSARRTCAVPANGCDIHQPPHRGDHDRAQDRLREVFEHPREGQQHDDHEHRRGDAGDLAPTAGLLGGRRLGEASGNRQSAGQPGGNVGGAHADELAFGLDPVPTTRGEEPGGGEPLCERHERQRHATDQHGAEIVAWNRREAERRETRGHVADHRDTVGLEIQQARRSDTEHEHEQPPRDARHESPTDDQHGERDAAHQRGPPVRLVEPLERSDQHADQVALAVSGCRAASAAHR